MNTFLQFVVLLLCVLQVKADEKIKVGRECLEVTDLRRSLGLSVVSRRNATGEWMTTFTALRDSDDVNVPNNISVDVSHSETHCQGRTQIRITGMIAEENRGQPETRKLDILYFDPKCGTNVAVVNNGRTVQKIKLDVAVDSVVFSSRPLKDDELFEVRLDKKHNKFGFSLGIGVTTHSPKDISIANHINNLPHPSWAYYHGHTYRNGGVNKQNYGKDLNLLMVGDRVGVMRSGAGNLHFYVNGVDQGPAASNMPSPVYGVVELWNDAAMATIVD